ncbi:MAG: flagellar biosynthesis protein FlhF [Phycisphaerales bacterium]|nr:flagellar biosynthesis protein FlhF [Phycisphaerales bacterium]
MAATRTSSTTASRPAPPTAHPSGTHATPPLKTFRGATVSQTLALVKGEFGPDAIIVSTRTFKAGSVLGVGGKAVVEIVASAAPAPPPAPSLRSALARVYEDVPVRRTPVRVEVPTDPPEAPASATNAVAPAAPATPPGHATPRGPRRLNPLPVDPAPADASALEALQGELGSIKTMVTQLLRCTNQASARVARDRHGIAEAAIFENGSLPRPLFAHYTRLLDAGVDVNFAQTVIASARDDLDGPNHAADPEAAAVRTVVLDHLARGIPCSPLSLHTGSAGRSTVVALIGPTGVGKTTTIAKLAADLALRKRRKVALVTCDTYRIGAVDQLKAYAEIIGVPLHVAASVREMTAAIRRAADAQIVLVDTAGRSPRDGERLSHLADVLDAANPDHRALVLSASASSTSIGAACQRFTTLKPDRLILTKLDEAPALGVLVNTPRHTGIPVSHVTTGQDVPDFILDAAPDRLAAAVLDAEIPR